MEQRSAPRFSVNALTKYLSANPARRRRLVDEQKRPVTFQVAYYEPASDVIASFLCDDSPDEDSLVSAIDDLYAREARNDYEAHRWPNNAEALQSFLEFYDEVDAAGLTCTRTPTQQPKLEIAGMHVSVFPQVTIAGAQPRHGPVLGGILLYLSKNDALSEATGNYSTTLLRTFLAEHAEGEKVLGRLSIVVDVFGQSVFTAPKAYRRLMKDIEAACEEIVLRW